MRIVILLVAISIVGVAGCEQPQSALPAANADAAQEKFNLNTVVTRGNFSYIPVNRGGRPSDIIVNVLELLVAFEAAHPNLEIVAWQIEKQQSDSKFVYDYFYGIWVTHRPKK